MGKWVDRLIEIGGQVYHYIKKSFKRSTPIRFGYTYSYLLSCSQKQNQKYIYTPHTPQNTHKKTDPFNVTLTRKTIPAGPSLPTSPPHPPALLTSCTRHMLLRQLLLTRTHIVKCARCSSRGVKLHRPKSKPSLSRAA